jgi:hypothetical protein
MMEASTNAPTLEKDITALEKQARASLAFINTAFFLILGILLESLSAMVFDKESLAQFLTSFLWQAGFCHCIIGVSCEKTEHC